MPGRERRSDAVANRDRIVEAARAELSESNGAADDLKLHRVAKAADVGQGTLYRHFPTREHLLAEVYRFELTQLVDAVAPLLAEHPPLEALTCWLDRLVGYARVKRGVMAAIEASAWQDLYADQHHRLDEALEMMLQRGKPPARCATRSTPRTSSCSWARCREYPKRSGTRGCPRSWR